MFAKCPKIKTFELMTLWPESQQGPVIITPPTETVSTTIYDVGKYFNLPNVGLPVYSKSQGCVDTHGVEPRRHIADTAMRAPVAAVIL